MINLYCEQFELPPELCAKPLALVGISGLDTLNNAVHKSVWETFSSNRRIERAPVLFRLIGNAHNFPVVKPKRNSYEWYVPKGILKKNWMNKHLNEIPAVVAIFYELDWNDFQWNEKMIECASRVQSIRAASEGRNTRIVVVLIQSTPPLPAGEDVLASERAVALCASCELNAKSLFVLPHGDHLQGYVVRLENAFYDLAQNYYHLEARNVKSHREHLNKTTHQYLFVRHQFKMGLLSELKQDNHTAHKHYTYAYNNLLEIRIVDTNAMEIRTVAGFINYKLCRLMFCLSLPRDAISQFRTHTDRFKMRIGFQELAFEHHAWMSKQFHVFGDIFDEAVKLGLPPVQTQHPGIYYQQAAQFALTRKQSCQEICTNVMAYPSPDPLQGFEHMEFYGQRPWRPGKLSAEPPDPVLESKGMQALQHLEKQVNHSNVIIALYGLAVSQFKTHRCPRMRRHLVVQMADEYYNSQDYGKALTLLTHMLWDYRTERWWNLLSDVLCKALRCAYLTASVQDYIMLSLELLGQATTISLEKKSLIFKHLNGILQKQIPEPESDLLESSVKTAVTLWKPIFSAEPQCFTIDMSNIISCIDCKARFMESKYQADQNVAVELYIRNTCPHPLQFSRVSVTINTSGYSSEFAVNGALAHNPSLIFNVNEIKQFLIEFMPDPNDVGKEIQIGAVNVYVGNVKECYLDLRFNGVSTDSINTCPELTHFRRSPHSMPDFDNINPLPGAFITPRQSKLNVMFEHAQPALVEEWYKINVTIINNEAFGIRDLEFDINLGEVNGYDETEFSITENGKLENLPLKVKLKDLSVSEKTSVTFYMRGYKEGPRNINIQFLYVLESDKALASVKEETLHVSVVRPFDINTKFLSTLFEDIAKFYVDETFVVMPVVSCTSPWPIIVQNTSFEFTSPIKAAEKNVTSQIKGLTLANGETGAEVYLGITYKQMNNPVSVGQYLIEWKRENGIPVITKIPVVGGNVDWLPLNLKITLPAHGLVRTPLLITYHLYNRSHQLLQLEISMEASEAFMFAGYKQLQISILPESERLLHYNLYPLVAGSVALPKLNLIVPENSTEGPSLRQDQLNQLLERTLPTHLFVMPQTKGSPKMPSNIKPKSSAVVQ